MRVPPGTGALVLRDMFLRNTALGAIALGLLTFVSCGSPPPPEPSDVATLVWEDRELERFAGECDGTEAPCGRFRAEYPEFTEAPAPGVMESLNEAVNGLLTDGRPETLADMANELIAAYRAARQEFPGAASTQRWEEEKVVTVLHHDDRLVSLKLEEYSNTGGAHPNARTLYGSWTLEDGGRVALEELLAPGGEERIAELGEAAFREVRGVPADQTLEELGFLFPDGEFALTENFAVTDEGLVFYFNPYEVAPYALGPTEIEMTFEALADLWVGR